MITRWMTGAAAAVLAVGMAGAAQAQSYIVPNGTVSGTLDAGDPVTDRGGRFDRWRVRTYPGQPIYLTMSSPEFDTYLQIGRVTQGGYFQELAYDDDGTGTLDSLLEFVGDGGEYEVRATSYGTESYGSYILSLSDQPPPAGMYGEDDHFGQDGLSQLPVAASGSLDGSDLMDEDGRYYDVYRIFVPNQHTVRVRVESDDVDPMVTFGLIYPDGYYEELGRNDDSGGTLNAEYYFQSVADDVFEVRPTTWPIGGMGRYRVYIEDVSPTPDGGLPIGVLVAGYLNEADNGEDYGPAYEIRSFHARAGQRIRITQRSYEIDSYLSVGFWDGSSFSELAADDDSGGGDNGLDAQVEFIAPRTGVYAARVSSYSEGQEGPFTLQIDTW